MEILFCLRRIMDNTQSLQLLRYHMDCTDIHFCKLHFTMKNADDWFMPLPRSCLNVVLPKGS